MKSFFLFFPLLFSFSFYHSNPSDLSKPLKSDYPWPAIADSLLGATLQEFISADGQFIAQDNGGNQTFHYWWNAHALDVLVDAHLRNKDQETQMVQILRAIKSNNEGHYPNNYYDDMEWLALSSLRAYHATGNREFLKVTEILWDDIKKGWNQHQGGGIAWRKSQTDYKNTPANAPAVILAGRMYKEKQDPEDLAWAKKIYHWQKSHLLNTSSGLVWDGVNRTGNQQIDKDWKFTYNQGVFIGAAYTLFEITKDKTYLEDAIRTTDFVISDNHLAPTGILKSEGYGDGGLFKGILIRYMMPMIYSPDVQKERKIAYRDFIRRNAVSMYQNIRRPEMLIGSSWTKQPEKIIDASAQLSGLMLIEAMADLEKH